MPPVIRLLCLVALWGLTSRCGALAAEGAADKTVLEIEILMPQIGGGALDAQRWRAAFEKVGESVRFRQPLGADKPDVSETTRGPFRVIKIVGALGRESELLFPGHRFTLDQTNALKIWLDELRVYGAQGSPTGQPLWGLDDAQFQKVLKALTGPVSEPFQGKMLAEAIKQVPLGAGLELKFHPSLEPVRAALEALPLADEVQGLSAGTALAYLLSQAGFGFRPLRTPSGGVELIIQPLKDIPDAWPVGWPEPEGQPRDQLLPELFKSVDTGIPSASLAAVFDAVEARTGVRILLDLRACEAKGIDPQQITVTYPRKKTAWALIVKSVAISSQMTVNYRQDEAGMGFVLIAPVTAAPPASKTPSPSAIDIMKRRELSR